MTVWVMAFFDSRQQRDRAAANLPPGLVDQMFREDWPSEVSVQGPLWTELVAGAQDADLSMTGSGFPSQPVADQGPPQARADAHYQLAVSTHRPDVVANWLGQHHAQWVEMSDVAPR